MLEIELNEFACRKSFIFLACQYESTGIAVAVTMESALVLAKVFNCSPVEPGYVLYL